MAMSLQGHRTFLISDAKIVRAKTTLIAVEQTESIAVGIRTSQIRTERDIVTTT